MLSIATADTKPWTRRSLMLLPDQCSKLGQTGIQELEEPTAVLKEQVHSTSLVLHQNFLCWNYILNLSKNVLVIPCLQKTLRSQPKIFNESFFLFLVEKRLLCVRLAGLQKPQGPAA